jgi:hypothetical protein
MKWTPPWCSGVLLWSSGRCFIGDAKYTNKKGVSSLAKAWHGSSKCRSNPVGGVWDSPRGWAHFSKGILEQCVLTFTTLCWSFNILMLPYLKYICIWLMVLSLIQDCWFKQFFFATYRMKVAGEATLAKLQGQQRQKRNMICMSKARQKSADDCLLTANANILLALSCLPGAVSDIPCTYLRSHAISALAPSHVLCSRM